MMVITRGASGRHVNKFHGVAVRDVSNIMDTKLAEVMSVTGWRAWCLNPRLPPNRVYVVMLNLGVNFFRCKNCSRETLWIQFTSLNGRSHDLQTFSIIAVRDAYRIRSNRPYRKFLLHLDVSNTVSYRFAYQTRDMSNFVGMRSMYLKNTKMKSTKISSMSV